MPKPNTFIIGAPKCGTTSLASWLSQHPDVFMSDPKEPYFFCRPSLQIGDIHTLVDYEALFVNAEGQAIIAEATTATIYDETALPRVIDYSPSCRVIVMLRNPVDMVLSWHGESVRQLREDLTSFSDAWQAVEDRRMGRRIPSACPDPIMLDYQHMGSLGTQLEGVYALVPRERVHVAFLDDYITAPRDAWLTLLAFLGIPDDGRQHFPAENVGYMPGHMGLYRIIRQTTASLKGSLGMTRSTGLVTRLTKALEKRKATEKPSLPAEFRDELSKVFEPEIGKLERLTGRDLTAWRSG